MKKGVRCHPLYQSKSKEGKESAEVWGVGYILICSRIQKKNPGQLGHRKRGVSGNTQAERLEHTITLHMGHCKNFLK